MSPCSSPCSASHRPWQDAGGACSSYLIEHDRTRVLLDCGNGAFARLREVSDYLEVPAVVISHLHADHILDLVPFSYALLHGPHRGPRGQAGACTRRRAQPRSSAS